MLYRTHIAVILLLASILPAISHAEEATDPQVLFEEAMALRDAGNIFRSIEVFETILSKQPGLGRARLELAVAYQEARRYEDAKEQLQKVLNDPDTPEQVKLTVTAYLAQLTSDEQQAKKRTSSSVYVLTGLFTDSNVNLGPTSETANTSLKEQSGTGLVVMASYSQSSRASKPFEMNDKLVELQWLTQATAYTKSYGGDKNDYNLQVLSLSTGPEFFSENSWHASANIKLDKIYFGNSPYAFNIGLNPAYTYNYSDSLDLRAEYLVTAREFMQDSDDGLDGIASMLGFSVTKYFRGLTVATEFGARLHNNGAKADALRAKGPEIYLTGQYGAWKHGRIYAEAHQRKYDYQGIDTAAGFTEARDETETLLILGISHDLSSGALKNWTLNGQYTHTRNDSNIAAFEYDRNIVEFNMRRYF